MKHIHIYQFELIHTDNVAKVDYYMYKCLYCNKRTHFVAKKED